MSTYTTMLSGYRERVARIALFDIFHQLENKQLKDNTNRPIDTFGVGLLSVLFFFESMLMRQRRIGVGALAGYLQDQLGSHYDMEQEGYIALAKVVIEVMRPPSGKRLKRRYFNYETGQPDTIEYAILKADDWDAEAGVQYYALDEQGLELIFATKEYFGEFQISISQLMLRKQLEKGEFAGALRQVDEMRINVHTIRDRMAKIRHEIQRNIISDDTYDRYKETIGDINRRLKQEHDEFDELMTFIHETKERLGSQVAHTDKEHLALEMIVRIDNELAHVHYLHASLLKDSIELKTTAIEAAGESLYYAGITAFNFDQEIARKLTGAPLPFTSSKILAAPFLGVGRFSTWSLLTVFEPQMLDKPQNKREVDFLEISGSRADDDTVIRQQIYALLLREMMPFTKEDHTVELTELLAEADNPIFGTREFCDFWLIMHQLSPLELKAFEEIDDHIFHQAFGEMENSYESIVVEELPGVVSVQENYSMRNMRMVFKR